MGAGEQKLILTTGGVYFPLTGALKKVIVIVMKRLMPGLFFLWALCLFRMPVQAQDLRTRGEKVALALDAAERKLFGKASRPVRLKPQLKDITEDDQERFAKARSLAEEDLQVDRMRENTGYLINPDSDGMPDRLRQETQDLTAGREADMERYLRGKNAINP